MSELPSPGGEAPEKCDLLGVGLSPVTYESAVSHIVSAALKRRAFAVSALAVHGVMTGVLDPVHRSRLNAFGMLVPDGQPVRWALRWLHGRRLPDRVYGPELLRRTCAAAAQLQIPVFFYGSTEDVSRRLCSSLRKRFPDLLIAGSAPSQFRILTEAERDSLNARIVHSGARIVFVGLGCPRQEVWAFEHAARLRMPVVAVGAAFPFEAGLLRQAPPALQRFGLEWASRLVAEPRRLWRRYVFLNPLYLFLVAMQMVGLRVNRSPSSESIPEVRYG